MKSFYSSLIFIFLSTLVSAQSGITWDMGMNVAVNTYDNLRPRITTDGNGNPIVIWGRSSDESVFIARWNGTAFTMPVKVNPTSLTVATANWMGSEIASKGDTVYVTMKETPEGDITSKSFITRSVDGGMNFNTPVMLDNFPDSLSRFPTVTTDATGNPIVGYMKFNSTFGDARWVVAKSTDLGNTFSTDVKASGWSSMTAEVCDCCPGAIVCDANNVAMLYRDNNANIRDTWCGISTDGGNSFSSGMSLDQNNWMLMMCPSSGPDGVIIGDTLYSTYMNGVSGNSKVYFSKASVSSGQNVTSQNITGTITGLSQQNYPRMAHEGNAVAVAWKQIVNGFTQLVLKFTSDITNGLPATYDTVDLDFVTNMDVAMANGKLFVVWEDDGSGTVKFRSGTYSVPGSIKVVSENAEINLYPNPAENQLAVSSMLLAGSTLSIFDLAGREIKIVFAENNSVNIDVHDLADGIYFLKSTDGNQQPQISKFIVQKEK